jgi:colicin import membrane protein
MKKNYVYIIAPLVATAIFTGIYWKYSATYDERIAEMHRKELEAAQAKLNEDAKNREIAAKAAFASQERRKKEAAEKKAREEREKDARDVAQQNMRKAQRDAQKLADRIKVIKRDMDAEKKEIAKLEEERKTHAAEQAFQRQYVKLAEDNVKDLTSVLEKIAETDKKWEEAAKEAAKAASAKK